ncbi:hypothetical protein CROQUDRAFT_673024 [Cronartium quercuum f. sp. fusiforme G11]|uniref:S-formylglutathione hydrolase n=1 Tax=Cronartium quercuum f. sp. fusiforme G11 TaxID=708437 RepID=A0A9P6NGQ3_9BASI|nr:hypothetical protein CROQUDRAFT_673024 [Cronartium quercuum f. sp. fusiforme G11]
MTPILEKVSSNKTHSGRITKYSFVSSSLAGLQTLINVFIPPRPTHTPSKSLPVLFYLAGLTCNEDTGPQKGGFIQEASKHGIALVFPDTSPRGAKVPGEEDDWDFELPSVLAASDLPLDLERTAIFGHSMGGHGALTLYLNHPTLYKSCSAFAPITNPTNCAWGKKAFTGPNGNDGYLANGLEEGQRYDATELIKHTSTSDLKILIDYGSADQFYKDGQLLPEHFRDAVSQSTNLKSAQIDVREQENYDHSYYFVNTFAADHLAFHAKHLNA